MASEEEEEGGVEDERGRNVGADGGRVGSRGNATKGLTWRLVR